MSGKMKELYLEALEKGGEEEVKKVQAQMDQKEEKTEEEAKGRGREAFTGSG